MKNTDKHIQRLIVPLLCLVLFACGKENYNTNPSEAYLTYVKDIKIVIGGTEIAGKINENKKEIYFPKLPLNTNLSAVSFKGTLPEGARFEADTYDFTPDEGSSQTKKTIAVTNQNRKREYFVTLRLNVPPTGADFKNVKVYNFSPGSGGTIYPDFGDAANARAADMDLEHVLIVGRNTTPHLLRLDDLKQGVINPVHLNQTGVTGGTFTRNAGRMVRGHVYICNLSTSFASTQDFRVYHWNKANPETAPDMIASYFYADATGTGTLTRCGDFMSADLDENGDGYIYASGSGMIPVLRIKVSGFTQTSEPTLIIPADITASAGAWTTYYQVEGSPNEFLFTGHQSPVRLVNANGQLQYALSSATFANASGGGAQIITFNKERYLITVNDMVNGAGIISVYNITKGSTTAEALTLFDTGDATVKTPLYTFSLGGNIPAANAAACTGWAKDGDNKLYIIGAGIQAGFAVIEFSMAPETDDFDQFEED